MILTAAGFDWTVFLNGTGAVGAFIIAIGIGVFVPGRIYAQLRADLEKAYSDNQELLPKVLNALTESNRLLGETNGVLRDIHEERRHERQYPRP